MEKTIMGAIRLQMVGFFREFDEGYEELRGRPSIHDFIDFGPDPEESSIIKYLEAGVQIGGVGGCVGDVLDPNVRAFLPGDIVTDGRYLWPEVLSYYVKRYHVKLPGDFVRHMRCQNWVFPIGIDSEAEYEW